MFSALAKLNLRGGTNVPMLVLINLCIHMKRIDQEFILDWYNTRGGRVIVKPKFGDKVTAKECLAPKKKDIPKKKIHSKRKVQTLKQFIKLNYTTTYVETSTGVVTLLRPITIETIKRNYPTAKSVYWGNSKLDIFSNITKL